MMPGLEEAFLLRELLACKNAFHAWSRVSLSFCLINYSKWKYIKKHRTIFLISTLSYCKQIVLNKTILKSLWTVISCMRREEENIYFCKSSWRADHNIMIQARISIVASVVKGHIFIMQGFIKVHFEHHTWICHSIANHSIVIGTWRWSNSLVPNTPSSCREILNNKDSKKPFLTKSNNIT